MHDDIFAILQESFLLLIIGMAVVFSFLTMLIGAIKLIHRFCVRFPGTELQSATLPTSPPASSDSVPPAVVAAITAAIHQHRQNK